MTDVLVIGDTFRCPELRHEIPLGVPDPFVYLEVGGGRHVYVGSMEAPRIDGLGLDVHVHTLEEVGIDELRAQGLDQRAITLEWVARAAVHAGLRVALVPHGFPAGHLDRIRREGIELQVEQTHFDDRRRVKSGHELAGVRRAQRAAEAGMRAAVGMLAAAAPANGGLALEGAELTVERVKEAVARAFEEHHCVSDDFIVAPAAQGALGHEMGHGPIRPGDPVVIDLWPRDRESACFADMTRTFVVGEPDEKVHEWHRLAKQTLDVSTAMIRPGVDCRSVYDAVCDVIEDAGYPTGRTKRDGEILADGFFHGLGHGVGLEVHELPYLGFLPGGELVAGDVITLEPGVYASGVGGVRLEDLVLVTEDGCEVLTGFPYDLEVRSG
jgi:Xaa-Pro aminopeptidase